MYKSALLMMGKDEFLREKFNPYEYLFNIDFIYSIKTQKFFSDMSFSYRGWRMIDSLEKG